MWGKHYFYIVYMAVLCSSFPARAGSGSTVMNMSVNVIQPTCETVFVDNLDFGLVIANRIGSFDMQSLKSQLSINCYGGGTMSLKVKFSPVYGTIDAINGVIRSSNPSVGYALSWASSEVGNINDPIKLEQELSFKTTNSTGMNTTSFNVLPVKAMPTVTGINADTQLAIHVIYD